MAKKDKRLWIDMCAGSELKDTQGETLSVDGADIAELEQGKGRFNDNHGKGFFNSLGRVTEAKKIMKAEDCENERHKYYWEKIKAPYVYAKGYLYNDEDHSNAKAAAAILRNIHREDAPLAMKASVEGGVISRGLSDPTRLARTKIHSVALTFTPANNATLVEPLNIDKTNTDWESDKRLIKSVMHLAETNIPSFRHVQRHASANHIHDNMMKIQELAKSLGIEMEMKESSPELIMKEAVYAKLAHNVNKINELVKAVKAAQMMDVMKPSTTTKPTVQSESTLTSPGKVQMAAEQKQAEKLTARDKFQREFSRMKLDPTTPAKPKDLSQDMGQAQQLKTGKQAQQDNTFKVHALRAHKNPEHLKAMEKDLLDRGIDAGKVGKILDRVRAHMPSDVKKGEDADLDVEKGEIGRAAKNLALAGVLGLAAHHMTADKDKAATRKPAQVEMSREDKIHAHNEKIKDPDMMINPGQYGYDERKPGSKKDFMERRKKFKGKLKDMALKKALTAGYGGSGAPTNLTGGGVFQTESLEGARKAEDKGFKYITCENCGKEQIYMQHQVKCRDCNKNFSLEKLENHM